MTYGRTARVLPESSVSDPQDRDFRYCRYPGGFDYLLYAPSDDPFYQRRARGTRDPSAAGDHPSDGRTESLYIKLDPQQDP